MMQQTLRSMHTASHQMQYPQQTTTSPIQQPQTIQTHSIVPSSHSVDPPSHSVDPPSHSVDIQSYSVEPQSHSVEPPSQRTRPSSHHSRRVQQSRPKPQSNPETSMSVDTAIPSLNPSHSAPSSAYITPTLPRKRRAANNYTMISRKYGLPEIDFAVPIPMNINKHNISHYSERESTAYSPTKVTKIAPRRGILHFVSLLSTFIHIHHIIIFCIPSHFINYQQHFKWTRHGLVMILSLLNCMKLRNR